MGIYVSLHILPNQIEDTRWETVFDEAVLLAESYPKRLMKFTEQEVYEATRLVLSRKIVDEENGTLSVCGDFDTRKRAEQFTITRKKPRWHSKREAFRGDIVLADREEHWLTVFHEKTQGYPYHIAVVALGALYESRFPKAAVVAGDIDLEDCKTAVEWANQVLETPISIPVLVDGQRLIDRLSTHCDPDTLEGRFRDIFRGSETKRRMFLIAHQKNRDAVQALAKELSGSKRLNIGALIAFRSWLDATHDLKGLFRACCTHEQGPKWEVSKIVSSLANLWVLNPVEETEELMNFIQQGGMFTLPTVSVFAAFYPELNPINSEAWYLPGVIPVIEAITAVTGRERTEIEALVTTAYQQQAKQIELMKQKASEEIRRVQDEEKRESAFNLDEFKASFASKIDEFKQFLRENKIPLTVETLLPLICKMADHNDIMLTEDAWSAIDNETDVETLIGVAFLFSISNRTNALVKGREEFIESGEYRKWFASN
jgi:hypothetical protein